MFFDKYSSICLMAVCRGLDMSEYTSCRELVAQEVVFKVMGVEPTFHLFQLLESHFPDMFRELALTLGKISKAFRPMSAMRQCHDIHFSALCRDACPAVLSASRPLSSKSVYSVYSRA
jgi:hypothetical protein